MIRLPAAEYEFSVILPTRNEAACLPEVIKTIRQTCGKRHYEILVVDDDSPDGTARVAEKLGTRVMVRKNKRGLASAILDGFLAAGSENVFVMDADGQHDLENFEKMIELLCSGEAELVIGCYGPERARSMGILRRGISTGATLISWPVTGNISDPMSGFFGVKRSQIIQNKTWCLRGFKLLPEIILRCPNLRVAQVQVRFNRRAGGQSKMNLKEVLDYLNLMQGLYFEKAKMMLGARRTGKDRKQTNTQGETCELES